METAVGYTKSWKSLKNLSDAKSLIEHGVVVKWSEMRSLKRLLSDDEQCEFLRFCASFLCQRAEDRVSGEIIVETVLIWLANSISESHSCEALAAAFLETLFAEKGHDQAARLFVEIALTSEVAENTHDEEIYATAVALICEMGIAIQHLDKQTPGKFQNAPRVLSHITTYLLSVSNNNNSCIRLSLLHYFGYTSAGSQDKSSFNRVMSRFGHTVLDLLLSHLFNKKSEAISLQFLLENLPFVLEADSHCQRILHETFKYYMLKKPERFALFLQTLSDHLLLSREAGDVALQVYLQHLGALFKVVSEVNHKPLARDILITVQKFNHEPFCFELINHILAEPVIRQSFKDLLRHLKEGSSAAQFAESVSQFRAPKRGRKPTFTRAGNLGTMSQVTFLGGLEAAKAS